MGWKQLHRLYPALSQVAIVGAPGARAEEPGHDLTYLADNGLVSGLDLPPTLYADMGGSLMAARRCCRPCWQRERAGTGEPHPRGVFIEVALADAAGYLALPRSWGLTQPSGAVGGAHAGYKVYACKDGRVAVAALEPHFAAALCAAAGVPVSRHRHHAGAGHAPGDCGVPGHPHAQATGSRWRWKGHPAAHPGKLSVGPAVAKSRVRPISIPQDRSIPMGNKIVTEADRKATPPQPLKAPPCRATGPGQKISLERGTATRSKKNPGKRAKKGG
jgi:hypothetical protein